MSKLEEDLEEIGVDEELLRQLLDASETTEYTIETNIDDGAFRLQFHNEDGVLSSFTTDAQGAYDLAQRVMRAYDKLEGIR